MVDCLFPAAQPDVDMDAELELLVQQLVSDIRSSTVLNDEEVEFLLAVIRDDVQS